jgi:hypothetical protein
MAVLTGTAHAIDEIVTAADEVVVCVAPRTV